MPYSFGHICMILNETGLTASLCFVGHTSTFSPLHLVNLFLNKRSAQ